MKKTSSLLLFNLALSTSTFAHLKSKQIVGKWKYEITISNSQTNGSFVFSMKDGEIDGENIQPDSKVSKLPNIKLNNKNETLCFNLVRESDLPTEFILFVDHNKFKGKGWINDVNFEIADNKITIQ